MQGSIGVESEPGKGSTFFFTARFEKIVGSPAATVPDTALTGMRVLVVDDNSTNRIILERQLLAFGMVAQNVADAQSALTLMRQEAALGRPFKVLLTDMQMPDQSGIELSLAVKTDPSLKTTRTILMSSLSRWLDERIQQSSGISAFLSKPIKKKQLLQCLRHILVPADVSATQTSVTPSVKEEPMRSLRILVAEDNKANQMVALLQLKKLGHSADVAANGREAVEALIRIPYDVILMDCQMPEMDGYAASREIRQREGNRHHTHIIAMTANVMEGDKERCLAAGMDDYVSKPVQSDNLKNALARCYKRIETAPDRLGSTPVSSSKESRPLVNEEHLQASRALSLDSNLCELNAEGSGNLRSRPAAAQHGRCTPYLAWMRGGQ
jgi:CheY-like chemotaxis protein